MVDVEKRLEDYLDTANRQVEVLQKALIKINQKNILEIIQKYMFLEVDLLIKKKLIN